MGRNSEKIQRKSNGSSKQAPAANQTEKKSNTQTSTSNDIEKSNVDIVRPLRSSTKLTTSLETPSSTTNYASNHTGSEPLRRSRVSFADGESCGADDTEMGSLTFLLPPDDGDAAVPK